MANKTEDNLKIAFGTLLDIPNIEVEKVKTDRYGDYIVWVKTLEKGTQCRICGKSINKSYSDDSTIRLRHLPLLGRKVYIRIQPARYQCTNCEDSPTTTQKLSWYEPKSPHTKAFDEHILLACVNSTIADASMKEDIGYEATMGTVDRHIKKSKLG